MCPHCLEMIDVDGDITTGNAEAEWLTHPQPELAVKEQISLDQVPAFGSVLMWPAPTEKRREICLSGYVSQMVSVFQSFLWFTHPVSKTPLPPHATPFCMIFWGSLNLRLCVIEYSPVQDSEVPTGASNSLGWCNTVILRCWMAGTLISKKAAQAKLENDLEEICGILSAGLFLPFATIYRQWQRMLG